MQKPNILEIHRLINKIHYFTEMIYSDALLLDLIEFSDYWKDALTQITEIKRAINLKLSTSSEDQLIDTAIKEELSRRIFLFSKIINSIPADFPLHNFPEIETDVDTVQAFTETAQDYFEKILYVRSEHLHNIPIEELKNSSDYSLAKYLTGMVDRVKNANAGTIVFAGIGGPETQEIQELLTNASFHTINLLPQESIYDIISTYDVSLICYDCGQNTMNGFSILQELVDDPVSTDIPILVCGSDYSDLLAMQFIEAGAVDYYSASRSKKTLFARIQAAIKRAQNNYHRQLYIRALELNKQSTSKEFTAASQYISDLLPRKTENEYFSTTWSFLPSLQLGGDIFGYYWLDEEHFIVYLLDVSGHGLEASLYSVTIMNLLNNELLGTANFLDPASIIRELNRIFPIEKQNNMFFTIWIGVYNVNTKELKYSNAGSQPAILMLDNKPISLASTGTIIGIDEDSEYENASIIIPANSDLYIFSDGIYEIKKSNKEMMELEEFIDLLVEAQACKTNNCQNFIRSIETKSITGCFEDDVSLLHLHFN